MMCECNCGNEAQYGNRFIKGHNLRKKKVKVLDKEDVKEVIVLQ